MTLTYQSDKIKWQSGKHTQKKKAYGITTSTWRREVWLNRSGHPLQSYLLTHIHKEMVHETVLMASQQIVLNLITSKGWEKKEKLQRRYLSGYSVMKHKLPKWHSPDNTQPQYTIQLLTEEFCPQRLKTTAKLQLSVSSMV